MQRQVPSTYLLIGDGRLAKHLAHYFVARGLACEQWCRRHHKQSALAAMARKADYILLLISDDSIDKFIRQHSFLQEKPLIHCSGALNSSYSQACHPLMTFGAELYPLSLYPTIPFVCDEGFDFECVFPQLNNPHFKLPQSKKVMYHAMAVMAANFPQFIWQHVLQGWQDTLHLPQKILQPLIRQSLLNSFQSPDDAPTGPFVRNDQQTIHNHKQVLANTELAELYRCFDYWLNKKDDEDMML